MKKITAALVIVAAVVSACVEPIVMDPLEEMPVVVNCVLTRESSPISGYYPVDKIDHILHPEIETGFVPPTQKLYLFYAKKPSESKYETISDAEVSVKCDTSTYFFSWNGSFWESKFLPDFDKTYFLHVKLTDGKELTASTVFPPCNLFVAKAPERVLHKYVSNPSRANNWPYTMGVRSAFVYGYYYNYFQSYGSDPTIPDKGFYFWVKAKEGGQYVDRLTTNLPGADEFNIVHGRFTDFSCYHSQNLPAFNFGITKSESDRVPRLETIEEDMESYLDCLRGDLSDAPVYGQFIRCYLDRSASDEFAIAADFDHHRQVPFMDLYGFDPEKDGVSPGLYIDTRFEFYFLSEEYDRYISSLARAKIHSDELVMQYFTPDRDYSNIENGIGCFGSMFHYTVGSEPLPFSAYYGGVYYAIK